MPVYPGALRVADHSPTIVNYRMRFCTMEAKPR
jgi:hypothetical protein